jgi:predicted transcriptional regulator
MANTKEYNIKINGINQSVEGVDKLGKSIGNNTNAIRETNKEIKKLQSEMVGLEKGSKAWTELAKKAGDLKDRVDDIREATRRYASDTKVLDDVINRTRLLITEHEVTLQCLVDNHHKRTLLVTDDDIEDRICCLVAGTLCDTDMISVNCRTRLCRIVRLRRTSNALCFLVGEEPSPRDIAAEF